MKYKKDGWNYLNDYRRYKGKVHQLYFEGKWINVNLRRDVPPNSNAPQ